MNSFTTRYDKGRLCVEYVYILEPLLRTLVTTGVGGEHPERRLPGIGRCNPDAVLVASIIQSLVYMARGNWHIRKARPTAPDAYLARMSHQPSRVVQRVARGRYSSCSRLG
jgi:hypothetical protein